MSRTDYDLTTIRGVAFDLDGVLSPSTIPMGDDGMPRRMVNIKDGYALQLAVKAGLRIAIITGGDGEAITRRYRALGITDVFLRAGDKLPVFERWIKDNGFSPYQVAYVGDDIPDLKPMRLAGLPVAPADAAVDVKAVASLITQAPGGYGVARELLEELLRARGQWLTHADAFGW